MARTADKTKKTPGQAATAARSRARPRAAAPAPAPVARVGIVAPSGYLTDDRTIDRAAAQFAQRGWQVQAGDSCFSRHERFAGPDELRAADMQHFCTDRSLDLVLAARGGYGMTRIVPMLDFAAIARAGRLVCGYSDFTAFNLALLARTGGISLHGPSGTDFGAENVEAFTLDSFFATVDQLQREDAFEAAFDGDGPALTLRGRLWGGNLALLCAMVGTPYFPSAVQTRGGVLFLEDVGEPAYKIERMLLQLEQAGILGRQRAILLGSFEPVPATPNDNGFSLARVIDGLRTRVDVPVITGLPFGHVPRKLTLPYGARVDLLVRDAAVRLSARRVRASTR